MVVPQVLTRDSVTVTVDAVVYYRVSNPTMVTKFIRILWKFMNEIISFRQPTMSRTMGTPHTCWAPPHSGGGIYL